MGLFNSNRPGLGVSKDTPRKKGILRFFEILSRDYRDLMKINLLFFLCVLPSGLLFAIGLLFFEYAMIAAVLASYPIGSGVAACMFCITKMQRDDAGYAVDDFKRKFRENLRGASIPGILATTFLYTQVFLFWLPILLDWDVAGTSWIGAGLALFILFAMVAPYVFLHYAYINLGTYNIIKNSIYIALSNFGRSFMGAITGLIPWILLLMFYPISLALSPLLPFFLFVLSWLLTLMWVWPIFDKHFSVEETLKKELADKYDK